MDKWTLELDSLESLRVIIGCIKTLYLGVKEAKESESI